MIPFSKCKLNTFPGIVIFLQPAPLAGVLHLHFENEHFKKMPSAR